MNVQELKDELNKMRIKAIRAEMTKYFREEQYHTFAERYNTCHCLPQNYPRYAKLGELVKI